MGQIKSSQIHKIEFEIKMVVVSKMDTKPFCFADSCRLKNTRGSEYDEANSPLLGGVLGCSQEEDDSVLKKQKYDGFINTDLDSKLKGLDVRYLIFIGTATNICLESTIRRAFSLASEASDFMCGQMILSDGGISAK